MKNIKVLGFLIGTLTISTHAVSLSENAILEKIKPGINTTASLERVVKVIRTAYSTAAPTTFATGQTTYRLPFSIPEALYDNLKTAASSFNPVKATKNDADELIQAPTIETTDLSQNEQSFINARLEHVAYALKKFGLPAAQDSRMTPRIAVCASGGGFRAMIATMGFWKGMEEIGLDDVILMAACLSGSTWFTTPWCLGKEIAQLEASYKKYALIPLGKKIYELIKNNKLIKPQSIATDDCLFAEMAVINNKFYQAFYWSFPYNLVQPYGNLVGHMTLAAFDDPEIIVNGVNAQELQHYITYAKNAVTIKQIEGEGARYAGTYTGPYAVQSRQTVYYSQAAEFLRINPGKRPLPLATSITKFEGTWSNVTKKVNTYQQSFDGYNWIWYSPFDVEMEYNHTQSGKRTGARIETKYLGKKYSKLSGYSRSWRTILGGSGKHKGYGAVNAAPEYTLDYLQGIWGSAFGISIDFIINGSGLEDAVDPERVDITPKDNTTGSSAVQHVKQALGGALKNSFANLTSLSDFRLFPAVINNFAIHEGSPFEGYDTIVTVDAGIAFNLPFPPLLKPERAIDIIIALDASADVSQGSLGALVGAEKWAQAKGIPFPKIASSKNYKRASKRTYTVFDEFEEGKTGPIVFYIPLIDNNYRCAVQNLIDQEEFSMATCLKGACSTFNFDYQPMGETDPHPVDELSNHVACAVKNMKTSILQEIQKVIKTKNAQAIPASA